MASRDPVILAVIRLPTMKTNPYSSPIAESTKKDSSAIQTLGCRSEIAWLFLPPLIFTVAGFVWYIIAASLVEYLVMPFIAPYKYPYGGPAIFLFLPLSTFYGLLTGLATCVFGSTQRRHGGVALIVVAAITVSITTYWWYQFENAAECNSKYVLFYPLFAISILLAFAGAFLTLKLNTIENGG